MLALALVAVCSFARERWDDWARQIRYGNTLVENGRFAEAEGVYATALKYAENAGDDLRAGVVLQNLGRLLDREGYVLRAEDMYLRAVRVLKRSAAGNDTLLVRAYRGLTALYIETGRNSRAEATIRRVLAEHRDASDADKAGLLGDLGLILARRRRFEEAEQILRKTAEASVSVSNVDIKEIGATAIVNIAGVQMHRGQTTEALASYRRALGIIESLPSPSPATFAITAANYADALYQTGDRSTAENLYRKAISVSEARLGPTHHVFGEVLFRYSEMLRQEGRKSEGRRLAKTARRILDESKRENLTGHTIDIQALVTRK